MSKDRHITRPAGFVAAGVKAGIKASGKEDLAIIASVAPASAAVLTTRNQVFGEPVRYCRAVLPRGYGIVRGIVINSGCSNVCTGRAGYRDAHEMARLTAQKLGCPPRQVLVASTGIIGHRLPMVRVRSGIASAADSLGTAGDKPALRAIMTTDLREKYAVRKVRAGGREITLAGMVKGSGMIAPSLATMIAVITTDARVSPQLLHRTLRNACGKTFDAVTVDSDTSTSDTVIMLASGAAGNASLRPGSVDYDRFALTLLDLCDDLARQIAADGEGATKFISITVKGAKSQSDASLAAKSVANSPLFKCAVHGGDPNWGRIAAALGKSPAKVDPDKLSISIGGTKIFSAGGPRKFDLRTVEKHLAGPQVNVLADLGLGEAQFTVYTCDLSREYIAINADYHT